MNTVLHRNLPGKCDNFPAVTSPCKHMVIRFEIEICVWRNWVTFGEWMYLVYHLTGQKRKQLYEQK